MSSYTKTTRQTILSLTAALGSRLPRVRCCDMGVSDTGTATAIDSSGTKRARHPYLEHAVFDRASEGRSLRKLLNGHAFMAKGKVAYLSETSGCERERSKVCNQPFCLSTLVKRGEM
jgi:hypothetical protein